MTIAHEVGAEVFIKEMFKKIENYESPEIDILKIQGEGFLCSSTENGNEPFEENDGIW